MYQPMPSVNVFTTKPYPLSKLLDDIEAGDIALPDLQRPFVWKPVQIRDLFDSLYRGFPVGFILLWQIRSPEATRTIGNQVKKREPDFLVIDGQQRLTSLYAVMKNTEVINDQFKKFKPKVSFNPLTEEFETYNPAIAKDVYWIDDISEFFIQDSSFSYINQFLQEIKSSKELSPEDEKKIVNSLERLASLKSYPFSVLELSSSLDVEMVSEVFTRVNSKGKELNQSDFVMTILAVYAPEVRRRIEAFAKKAKEVPEDGGEASPYNTVLHPDTDHLIRVVVADAFTRGRLKYAHALLKGRDLKTHKESEVSRHQSVQKFQESVENALHLTVWHDFIKTLKNIGLVSPSLISSKLSIYFTYALYLHGRRLKLSNVELEKFVGAWLFASILTRRYVGSPESIFERDVQLIHEATTKEVFIETYQKMVSNLLTSDFWTIQLPNELESQSSRNPGHLAYLMVLNMQDAKALCSETRLRDVFGGDEIYHKALLDRHHLFPANYLKKQGLKQREINQVANMCYLEYQLNIEISDQSPSAYFPALSERCSEVELRLHAIPERFWEMEYKEFLERRRKLMSEVIKEGINKFLVHQL